MSEDNKKVIFQQFHLILEKVNCLNPIAPYKRWEKVKQALKVQGFSLLCDSRVWNGVPITVMLGLPKDCLTHLTPSKIFYELTSKFSLQFKSSREYYQEEFRTRTSSTLLSDENYIAFIKLQSDECWFNDHLGQWVGFVGGKLVTQDKDKKIVLKHLQTEYPENNSFLTQVLAEEDKEVINFP